MSGCHNCTGLGLGLGEGKGTGRLMGLSVLMAGLVIQIIMGGSLHKASLGDSKWVYKPCYK